MKSLFVYIIIIFFNCSCISQTVKNEIPPVEATNSPYYIDLDDLEIHLPDTLTGNMHLTGRAGLVLFIDNKKFVKGFNIRVLQLYGKSDSIVNYYKYYSKSISCDEYPVEIKKYCTFFSKYIKLLPLKKNSKAKVKKMNTVFFMLKVK